MINQKQFRELIIQPTLNALQLYSDDAEELLIFTMATESLGGTYIKQVKGPALGVYQCEPATHQDLWVNFIFNRLPILTLMTMHFHTPRVPNPDRLIYDLRYATAIARLHYRRFAEPIPSKSDVEGMWEYYKQYYNTPKGKADKDKSIEAYKKYIK
jgi:hypothetical protein